MKLKRLLLLVALVAIGIVGLDVFILHSIRQGPSYALAVSFIRSHPDIRRLCGEPLSVELSFFGAGHEKTVGESGNANLNLVAKGTRNTATVTVDLKMTDGKWAVTEGSMLPKNAIGPIALSLAPTQEMNVPDDHSGKPSEHGRRWLFTIGVVVVFVAWLAVLYNFVHMIRCRKSSVPLSRFFNILPVFPTVADLSPEGLPYRKHVFIGLAVLAVTMIAMFLL